MAGLHVVLLKLTCHQKDTIYLLPACGSQKRIVCILQNAGATVV